MTIENQLDCTASPLTFVSDQVYPSKLDPLAKPTADNENEIAIEDTKTTTPANQFEGFGSFS